MWGAKRVLLSLAAVAALLVGPSAASAQTRSSSSATYYGYPGYSSMVTTWKTQSVPVAVEPGSLSTTYTAPAYTSSVYPRPIIGLDAMPVRRDPLYTSSRYAAGPANFLPGLNDYYPSLLYWNYYYPGY